MRILMCFCLTALLVACSGTKEKESDNPMTVKVFQAQPSVDTGEREFTFISKPYKVSDLSFRVGGPVLKFDVQPGQRFRKGEIIASIDNRDFVVRKEKVEAVYVQTKAEYKRIEALFQKDNVSGSSYEKAKSDLAIAKAAFEMAKNELDDTRLLAPFDGYAQTVYVESFQDVRSSQPIVTFIDLSKVKVETYIPENVAMNMKKYSRNDLSGNLAIRFDALADKRYTANEVEISMSTTSNNLSFMLTAILDNPGGELLGGMSGMLSMRMPEGEVQKGVYVPQTAICHSPQAGTYVWTVDENTCAKKIPVRIGNLANGNRIEILAGVEPGDKVIFTGLSFLADNKKVTIQN